MNNSDLMCYDPIMASNVSVKNQSDSTIIYVLNKDNKIAKVYCLDEDSLQHIIKNNDNIFYRCKDNVPMTATMITTNSVLPKRLRKIAMDIVMYTYENQVRKMVPGKKYIFTPTNEVVGRIASYNVVKGGNIVSADHCQTNYNNDYIYNIRDYTPLTTGAGIHKTKKQRMQLRKKKTLHRKH